MNKTPPGFKQAATFLKERVQVLEPGDRADGEQDEIELPVVLGADVQDIAGDKAAILDVGLLRGGAGLLENVFGDVEPHARGGAA